MRWYARPEGDSLQLKVAPELASWNGVNDPEQVRLRPFLDETAALIAAARVDGHWALRLDVGRPTARDLLGGADLDNFVYPLACRLDDPELVSVWCTKQYNERSFVRIEAACGTLPPSSDILVARTNGVSYTKPAFKEQIRAAVASATELPVGRPVRLELAFVVGSDTKWWNLWKPAIDALDPLLGPDPKGREWHPLDGRITELGMHLVVDPALRYEVVIGISASAS